MILYRDENGYVKGISLWEILAVVVFLTIWFLYYYIVKYILPLAAIALLYRRWLDNVHSYREIYAAGLVLFLLSVFAERSGADATFCQIAIIASEMVFYYGIFAFAIAFSGLTEDPAILKRKGKVKNILKDAFMVAMPFLITFLMEICADAPHKMFTFLPEYQIVWNNLIEPANQSLRQLIVFGGILVGVKLFSSHQLYADQWLLLLTLSGSLSFLVSKFFLVPTLAPWHAVLKDVAVLFLLGRSALYLGTKKYSGLILLALASIGNLAYFLLIFGGVF